MRALPEIFVGGRFAPRFVARFHAARPRVVVALQARAALGRLAEKTQTRHRTA